MIRLWLLCGFLSAVLAAANTEQIVTSQDGQRPYLIVTADTEGGSKRAPGVYVADTKGAWHEIVSGKLLSGRFTQGILALLKLTQFDQRYEAIAVVDGKLSLFSVNTRLDDPSSLAVLGSPALPFVDILHNSELNVPNVESVDDINLFAAEPTEAGQLVLMSVKLKEPSLHGDGITFALYVKAGDPKSGKLELSGPPTVLDYRFQNVNQLRRLCHESAMDHAVISRVLIQSLARRNPSDPQALVNWKNQIRAGLELLDSGREAPGMPFFDVTKGTPALPVLVRDHAGTAHGYVFQVYDPLNGLDGVVFMRGGGMRPFTPSDYTIMGRITLTADGKAYRFYQSRDVRGAALAYINRDFYFILDSQDEPYLLKLDASPPTLPDELDYAIIPAGTKDAKEFYLLLSTRYGSTKKTELIFLRQAGVGYEVAKRFDVYKDFLTYQELKARLVSHDGHVLFDSLTEQQPSLDAYRQVVKETMPYLDLTESELPTTVVQSYVKPLEDHEMGPHARYRVFDPKGAVERQTGIYLLEKGKKVSKAIRGELLQKDGQTSVELAVKAVPFDSPAVPTKVSVTALDAGFLKGQTAFKLVTVTAFDGPPTRHDYFPPVADEMGFNLPFSQLAGLQILQGSKKSSGLVYLLFRFDKAPAGIRSELPEGGVFCLTLRLSTDKKGEVRVERVRHNFLTTVGISDAELKHRLRRDTTDGKLYFIVDPAADPTSSGFKINDLASGRDILPNSLAERSKKFVEQDNDDDSDGWYGRRSTSWETFGPYRLKEIYPKLLPDVTDTNLSAKAKEEEETFPELLPALDKLASSGEQAQHQVFIVPKYLKDALLRAAFLLWADKDRPKHDWSNNNYRLKLFMLDPQKATQEEALDNLEAMRKLTSPDRAVFFGDMKDIVAINRPGSAAEAGGFTITDPSHPAEERRAIHPHLLYLLGTEGELLDLSQYESRTSWINRFSTLLLSTPAEWAQAVGQLDPEAKFGILNRFKINTSFYHGTWKLWPPHTPHANAKVQSLEGQPVSEFEKEVFPNLEALLNEASSPTKPAKHRVLIVPPELKSNIMNLVVARWIHSEDPEKEPWSRANPKLSLYLLDPQKAQTQDDIFENLDALRAVPDGSRGVLVSDLADIAKIGRTAQPGAVPFKLNDFTVGPAEPGAREAKFTETAHSPHLLYLLETEGKKLQLDELEKRKEAVKNSMILVGTAAEWEGITRELNPEGRVSLAEKFELMELPIPSIETRRALLKRVTERPEIVGLGYKFDATKIVAQGAKPLSESEAMEAVLGFMVSKCELLAKQSNKEVITTFIQYLNTFASSLVQDEVLRKRKVIDRIFVERLFSKVFSMPLNLAVLPKDDPLVRLSQQDAVLELQAAGYEGPIELKLRVIQALLAQTRVDPVRPIPSSIILFGETGSGKTHLFKTLCRMLNLSLYDYARPTDTSAQALIVNVGKLRPNPKETGAPDPGVQPITSETMTVDQAMKHVLNFLASPNGYRGYILFDDAHLASDEVRSQIMTFLRSLFEATNGMYRVTSASGKPVEIPVRNLSIFMTLNPTDDMERIRKYSKSGDELDLVLASLAGKDVPIDRSFLGRWSLVMNLSLFPVEAKAPKLRDSVRDAARDTFNNQNHLVVVSPQAIRLVANQFQKENARSFLSAATPELIARAAEVFSSSSLSVVVPRSPGPGLGMPPFRREWGEASGRTGAEIENFIQTSVVAIPVKDRFDGQLEFLKILVDTFRTQVLEGLTKAVSQDVRYAGDAKAQKRLLAPMLHALTAHLMHADYIPVSSLNLDPYDFGATSPAGRDQFRKALDAMPDSRRIFFPVRFGDEIGFDGALDELIDHTKLSETERNRAHVLSETVDKMLVPLQAYLAAVMRVPSLSSLPTPEAWLKGLTPTDPVSAAKELGTRLSELFFEFYDELYQKGLAETTSPEKFAELSTYDAVRLYLITLDKAMTKLSWGSTLKFMIHGLELATRDMAMGQLQGVQHYVFNSKLSLVRPMTHELVLQMASNSEAFRQWKEETRAKAASEFTTKCSRLLVQPGEGK